MNDRRRRRYLATSTGASGPMAGWSYYKEVTLSGTAGAGYPIDLLVWAGAVPVSFDTQTAHATNVGAIQSIITDGTWVFTTGGDSGSDQIWVYPIGDVTAGSEEFKYVNGVDSGFNWPTGSTQINGMEIIGSTLYCSFMNFSGTPERSWVQRFTITAGTGALTFVDEQELEAFWQEGLGYNPNYPNRMWAAGQNAFSIREYNTTDDSAWVFVKEHTLPGLDPGDGVSGGNYFQDLTWKDDVVYFSPHGANANSSLTAWRYWFDGTDFHEYGGAPTPQYANQGMNFDEDHTNMWMAQRVTTSNGQASSYTLASEEGVGLEGNSLSSGFGDVRITNADGTVILAGDGNGYMETDIYGGYTWIKFALDEAMSGTKTIRIYYGKAGQTFSEDITTVSEAAETFEGASHVFTEVYGSGSMTKTAGGVKGSYKGVTHNATSSGISSPENTFIDDTVARRIILWQKTTSDAEGRIYFCFGDGTGFTENNRISLRSRGNTTIVNDDGTVNHAIALTNHMVDSWVRVECIVEPDGTFPEPMTIKAWFHGGTRPFTIVTDGPTFGQSGFAVQDITFYTGNTASPIHVDQVISSEYISTHPTFGTWSAEQSN